MTAALFCVLFDRVYALYAHGVESAAMSLMFLYPLLGGAAMYVVLWHFDPFGERVSYSRCFRNAYNAGLSTLTAASAMQGVMDIAGTSSPYTAVFVVCGAVLSAVALLGYVIGLIRSRAIKSL
jgi:hypothetical protein